jgi:hypothetical protein
LTVELILAWADAHHAAAGAWPNEYVGQVCSAPFDLTWSAVNKALEKGRRGLPGGTTLRRLLREKRHVWGRQTPEQLSLEQILAWADAHHAANGDWPRKNSGTVRTAPFHIEWASIDGALRGGKRGLPGGSSLGRLLAEERAVQSVESQEPLTIEQILAWADAHHEATGKWPTFRSGAVERAHPPLKWAAIDDALRNGLRGLPAGSSLSTLLVEHRQVQSRIALEPLTVEAILAWADAHRAATGTWPGVGSEVVQAAPFPLTWCSVNLALKRGLRGLPGGLSLARVLAEHRHTASTIVLQPLTTEQIVAWAEAHRSATGRWPEEREGQVKGAPYHLTWRMIDEALRAGQRGLPGGSSLRRLRAKHDSEQQGLTGKPLRAEQIFAWADAFYTRHGHWPNRESGRVKGAPGESWKTIDAELRAGSRGLPGGNSLFRFLSSRQRPARPPLTLEVVRAWMSAHKQATGEWPSAIAGPVTVAPGEDWNDINGALRDARRGLPGGMSLAGLSREGAEPKTVPESQVPVTVEQILDWAQAHHAATGRWPYADAGRVAGTSQETWHNICTALRSGRRGLPGGMKLADLIAQRFGARSAAGCTTFTIEQILAWADAYHAAHSRWPAVSSGPIPGTAHDTWSKVNTALRQGLRGLPGGSSLARLLAQHGRGGSSPPR